MKKKVNISRKPTAERRPSVDEWVSQDVSAMSQVEVVEPIKRLTIDVPLSLHHRVKVQCAIHDLRMADVVREMLEARFPQAGTMGDSA